MLRFLFLAVCCLGASLDAASRTLAACGAFSGDELDRLSRALERAPRPGALFDRWYVALLMAEDRRERLRDWDESGEARQQWILALLAEHEGRRAEARQRLERVHTALPDQPGVLLQLAQLALDEGRWSDAVATTDAALLLEPAEADRIELEDLAVRALLASGERELALSTLQQCIDRDPQNDLRRESIAVRLEEEGAFDEALAQFEILERRTPPSSSLRLQATLSRARLLQRLGASAKARQVLETLRDSVDDQSWIAAEIERQLESLVRATGGISAWIERLERRRRDRADDTATLEQLCDAYREAGRIEQALECARARVEIDPQAIEPRLARVRLLRDSQHFADAEAEARAVLQRAPDRVDALLLLTEVLRADDPAEDGVQQGAVHQLWTQFAGRIESPDALTRLAEACTSARSLEGVLSTEGDFFQRCAEDLLQRAIQLQPVPARYAALARAKYRRLARDEARAVLGEMLRSHTEPEALEYAADVAAEGGDTTLELTYLESLVDGRPEDVRVRQRLATALEGIGDRPAADRQWAAVQSRTHRAEELALVLQRRAALAVDRREIEVALTAARTAAKVSRSAADLWWIAVLEQALGEGERAIEALEQVAALEPENAEVAVARARQLVSLGRNAEARAAYDVIARRFPARARHAIEERAPLELEDGDTAAALRSAKSLLAQSEPPLDSLVLAARILEQCESADRAVTVLRRAVRLRPDDLALRSTLADLLDRTGAPEEADQERWRCYTSCDDPAARGAFLDRLAQRARALGTEESLIARVSASFGASASLERRFEEARLCRTLGRSHDAASALASVTDLDRASDELLALTLEFARTLDDSALSCRVQEELVRRHPDAAALEELARAYHALGDRAGAVRAFSRWFSLQSGERLELVDRLVFGGDDGLAVDALQGALLLEPNGYALLHRTAILALRTEDEALARRALLRLIDLAPAPLGANAEHDPTAGFEARAAVDFVPPWPFVTAERVARWTVQDGANDAGRMFRTDGTQVLLQQGRISVSSPNGPPPRSRLCSAADDGAFDGDASATHRFAWPPTRSQAWLGSMQRRLGELERSTRADDPRPLARGVWIEPSFWSARSDALLLLLERFAHWAPVSDTAVETGREDQDRYLEPLAAALLALGRWNTALSLLPALQRAGHGDYAPTLLLLQLDAAARGDCAIGDRERNDIEGAVESLAEREPAHATRARYACICRFAVLGADAQILRMLERFPPTADAVYALLSLAGQCNGLVDAQVQCAIVDRMLALSRELAENGTPDDDLADLIYLTRLAHDPRPTKVELADVLSAITRTRDGHHNRALPEAAVHVYSCDDEYQFEEFRFPHPCAGLDIERLALLHALATHEPAERLPMWVEALNASAATARKPSDSTVLRLSALALRWWSGERSESLDALDGLAEQVGGGDSSWTLARVLGRAESSRWREARDLALELPAPWRESLVGELRVEHRSGSAEQVLDCLDYEWANSSMPEHLEEYFPSFPPYARSEANASVEEQRSQKRAAVFRSFGYPVTSGPYRQSLTPRIDASLPTVLFHARSNGRLPALLEALRRQLRNHRDEVDLLAITVLAALESNAPDAEALVHAWWERAHWTGSDEQFSAPAWILAAALCCSSTRAWASERVRELLGTRAFARITATCVQRRARSEVDAALLALANLPAALDQGWQPIAASTADRALVAIAEALNTVEEELRDRTAQWIVDECGRRRGLHRGSASLRRVLPVVWNQRGRAASEERLRHWFEQGLEDLFPEGPDQLPRLCLRSVDSRMEDVDARFLDALFEMARAVNELRPRLESWHEHPRLDHPSMLLIRMNAAAALEEFAERDALSEQWNAALVAIRLAAMQTDVGVLRERFQQVLDETEDRWTRAWFLRDLATREAHLGELERSRDRMLESLFLDPQCPDPEWLWPLFADPRPPRDLQVLVAGVRASLADLEEDAAGLALEGALSFHAGDVSTARLQLERARRSAGDRCDFSVDLLLLRCAEMAGENTSAARQRLQERWQLGAAWFSSPRALRRSAEAYLFPSGP